MTMHLNPRRLGLLVLAVLLLGACLPTTSLAAPASGSKGGPLLTHRNIKAHTPRHGTKKKPHAPAKHKPRARPKK
jgi:hypothetical protein